VVALQDAGYNTYDASLGVAKGHGRADLWPESLERERQHVHDFGQDIKAEVPLRPRFWA